MNTAVAKEPRVQAGIFAGKTEAELLELKIQKLRDLDRIHNNNRIYFWEPYPWMVEPHEKFRPEHKKNLLIVGPNKIGKTAEAAILIISWCLGFEPWHKDELGFYVRPTIKKRPPVKIRVTGEDWTFGVGGTIIPELKKWAPAAEYVTKKNTSGVEYLWTFSNGSTIECMTYDQDIKAFEGWLGHGWWADEPPPHAIFTAMSRGLMLTGGKMVLTMTPLKEAWILDELVLANRADTVVVSGLSVLDNPNLLKHDKEIVDKFLPSDKVKEYFTEMLKVEPDFNKFEIPPDERAALKIERFVRDTPPEEREARILGKFKSLAGLVIKKFDSAVNVVDDFKVPTDWPVVAGIDLHLKLPQAIGFYTVDKFERDYVCGEIWENLSPLEIAEEIIRFKKFHSLRMRDAFIDPLSKGDDAFSRNRGPVEDSFTIISRKLATAGIKLHVGSKDKASGVRNIQDRVVGANKMPALFFMRKCVRHIFEIQRWIFEDNIPKKENDHMMENLYRYTLFNNKYTPVRDNVKDGAMPNVGVV